MSSASGSIFPVPWEQRSRRLLPFKIKAVVWGTRLTRLRHRSAGYDTLQALGPRALLRKKLCEDAGQRWRIATAGWHCKDGVAPAVGLIGVGTANAVRGVTQLPQRTEQ